MTYDVMVGVARSFKVTGSADLNAETDALMDALIDLEDDILSDASVGVNLADSIVDIEIVARAASFEEAAERADAAIRTAIHAVGGETSDWNSTLQLLRRSAELVTS